MFFLKAMTTGTSAFVKQIFFISASGAVFVWGNRVVEYLSYISSVLLKNAKYIVTNT